MQLQTMGLIIPAIFLAVSAFLLNIVLTRLIAVQREQIAALKALGYTNSEIAAHYVSWALAVALTGTMLGALAGIWLGSSMMTFTTISSGSRRCATCLPQPSSQRERSSACPQGHSARSAR